MMVETSQNEVSSRGLGSRMRRLLSRDKHPLQDYSERIGANSETTIRCMPQLAG